MKLNKQELDSLVNSILREERKVFEKKQKTEEEIKKEVETSILYNQLIKYIEEAPEFAKPYLLETISRKYRQTIKDTIFCYVKNKLFKNKEFKPKHSASELKDLIVLNMIDSKNLNELLSKIKVNNPLI